MHVFGLALPSMSSVTTVRLGHPFQALQSLGVLTRIGIGELEIKENDEPGVLILYRAYLNNHSIITVLSSLIEKGWLIINDIDDDLIDRHDFKRENFFCLRYVHAVTVSTPRLAEMLTQYNPNTYVLPNAVPNLSDVNKKDNSICRIFFGALNRYKDWCSIKDTVVEALSELDNLIEFIVVHDRQVFDDLPESIPRRFYSTLPFDDYFSLLSQCHISLLPLNLTRFNLAKSDLKFIESCAAGCVPIFSPVVYGEIPIHRVIGLLANEPFEWKASLKSLVLNKIERERRLHLGREYVSTCRLHSHQAISRLSLYQSLLSRRADLERQRIERFVN
jgi:hypothetical protein